jgi:hypothetical protein
MRAGAIQRFLGECYVIACPDCREGNDQPNSNALDAHALSFRQKERRTEARRRISYVFPFRQEERKGGKHMGVPTEMLTRPLGGGRLECL